jgi:hypothetical protein
LNGLQESVRYILHGVENQPDPNIAENQPDPNIA